MNFERVGQVADDSRAVKASATSRPGTSILRPHWAKIAQNEPFSRKQTRKFACKDAMKRFSAMFIPANPCHESGSKHILRPECPDSPVSNPSSRTPAKGGMSTESCDARHASPPQPLHSPLVQGSGFWVQKTVNPAYNQGDESLFLHRSRLSLLSSGRRD